MGQYGSVIDQARMPAFNFTPNEYDPQLMAMRRRALFGGQQNYESGVNELSRSGLLGSSVGLRHLAGINNDTERNVEDVVGQNYGTQRAEALGLYSKEQDFRHNVYLQKLQDMQAERQARMQMWSNLGQGAAMAATYL